MLDQAFEALKTYDWGAERNVLEPINEAVIKCRSDAALKKDLESRLAAALKPGRLRDPRYSQSLQPRSPCPSANSSPPVTFGVSL